MTREELAPDPRGPPECDEDDRVIVVQMSLVFLSELHIATYLLFGELAIFLLIQVL